MSSATLSVASRTRVIPMVAQRRCQDCSTSPVTVRSSDFGEGFCSLTIRRIIHQPGEEPHPCSSSRAPGAPLQGYRSGQLHPHDQRWNDSPPGLMFRHTMTSHAYYVNHALWALPRGSAATLRSSTVGLCDGSRRGSPRIGIYGRSHQAGLRFLLYKAWSKAWRQSADHARIYFHDMMMAVAACADAALKHEAGLADGSMLLFDGGWLAYKRASQRREPLTVVLAKLQSIPTKHWIMCLHSVFPICLKAKLDFFRPAFERSLTAGLLASRRLSCSSDAEPGYRVFKPVDQNSQWHLIQNAKACRVEKWNSKSPGGGRKKGRDLESQIELEFYSLFTLFSVLSYLS